MQDYKDLEMLLRNFDEEQLEIITCIAARMAAAKSDRYTGKTVFELNTNQGGLGDMRVDRSEVVRLVKKNRRIRSSGI